MRHTALPMRPKSGKKFSPEQKKIQLYLEQKKTLEAFLERGAISKSQFDKSLGDLTVKMGMTGLTIMTLFKGGPWNEKSSVQHNNTCEFHKRASIWIS